MAEEELLPPAYLLPLLLLLPLLTSTSLLYYFGDWYRQRLFVSFFVLLAWYFSLLIPALLPYDVAVTLAANQYKEANHSHLNLSESEDVFANFTGIRESPRDHLLPLLYRITYWSTQFLTWILLPLTSSYISSGSFTPSRRLRSAILDNAVLYSVYLFICAILLAYIAAHGSTLTFDRLKAIAASASNSWGLFLVVLTLGHGLISLPLRLYRRSRRSKTAELRLARIKVYSARAELISAEESLEESLEELGKVLELKKRPGFFFYAKEVDEIDGMVPAEWRGRVERQRSNNRESGENVTTLRDLEELNRKLKKALASWNKAKVVYSEKLDKGVEVEESEEQGIPRRRKRWRDVSLRVLALLLFFCSILIIWSEATFSVKSPVLSIPALLVNYLENEYLIVGWVGSVVFYLFLCTFTTAFHLRIFNFYHLSPRHSTDEGSLLFSAMLLSRLTPPLALNVLSLLHLDSHILNLQLQQETAYTSIMGHMDVLTVISQGFYVYFPLGILLVSLGAYFGVVGRVWGVVGGVIGECFGEGLAWVVVEEEDEGEESPGNEERGWAESEGRELIRREVRKRRGRGGAGQSRERGRTFGGENQSEASSSDHHHEQQPPPRASADQHFFSPQPSYNLFDDV